MSIFVIRESILMKYRFGHNSNVNKNDLLKLIINSYDEGIVLVNGSRNKIKVLNHNQASLAIKSFKIPNLFNKITYRFFRKSKARRSFEFANELLKRGIKTPNPIAYFEETTYLGIRKSYYVCDYLEYDFSIREVIKDKNFPNRIQIINQFTHFTFKLHELGIEFLDHSPGNTLIKDKEDGLFDFYLVDLNRMKFHNVMTFEQRMKNFSRLSIKEDVIKQISREYAKLYNLTSDKVYNSMSYFANQFVTQNEFKKQLKNKILFYRS